MLLSFKKFLRAAMSGADVIFSANETPESVRF